MNTRHKNWALLIVVALVCFFAPKPIAVGLLGAKSYTPWVFMALQILLPFVALPLVRSLWPSHTKRAFAIFYLLANWPLILSVVVGGGWALTCFFISGPCH